MKSVQTNVRRKPSRVFWLGLVASLLLLGLILGTAAHPSLRPTVRNRPKAEIMMLSAAIENYKVDNDLYPSDPSTTEKLRPGSNFDPAAYVSASAFLYHALSGDPDGIIDPFHPGPQKCYFAFRPRQLRTSSQGHKYIVDQWGNSLGYSTYNAAHPSVASATNLTFDLWSTGGGKSVSDREKWVKNH